MYYRQGYLVKEFKKKKSLSRMLNLTKAACQDKQKEGFRWEKKYENSLDFRPSVFEYDPSFVDVLFENDIPSMLKETTGEDLVLIHIQMRRSFPGKSYMPWHRDTRWWGGKIVGNIPPVHKIIMYPTLGKTEVPRLTVAPGSHIQVLDNKYVDFAYAMLKRKERISSSDTKFLLFNTVLFHNVVPDTDPEGSVRIIYAFARPDQAEKYAEQRPLQELYLSRVAK